MNFKPIDTFYKDYYFRSRIEARWAVYFDTLNIRWEYELEGFELPPYKFDKELFLKRHLDSQSKEDKTIGKLNAIANCMEKLSLKPLRYLPDFWLSDLQLWAEIKHKSRLKEDFIFEFEKMMRFVNYSKKSLLLCTNFSDPVFLLRESSEMGMINYHHILLTKDNNKHDEATKKAIRARFEYGESGY